MRFIPVELRNFLASRLLFSLARHLVTVFVPLLLYGRGLALWQIFAFYGVTAGFTTPLCYLATRFINRFGERAGYLVGYGSTAAYQLLLGLYVGHVTSWVFYLVPVALAASDMFLVVDNTIHVSRTMGHERHGSAMALIQILAQIASALGPCIGAYVAVHFGVLWLAVTAAVLMALGLVPVWRIGQQPAAAAPMGRISYRPLPPLRDLLANFSFQWFANVGMTAWPIYLAIVTPGFRAIGGIMSVGLGVALGLVVGIGRLVNHRRHHLALKVIVALIALTNLGRFVSDDPIWLTIVTAAFAALFSCFNVAWFGSYYKLARREGHSYILAMETAGTLAACTLWCSLGVISYFSGGISHVFQAAFIGGAVVVWGCLLLRRVR